MCVMPLCYRGMSGDAAKLSLREAAKCAQMLGNDFVGRRSVGIAAMLRKALVGLFAVGIPCGEQCRAAGGIGEGVGVSAQGVANITPSLPVNVVRFEAASEASLHQFNGGEVTKSCIGFMLRGAFGVGLGNGGALVCNIAAANPSREIDSENGDNQSSERPRDKAENGIARNSGKVHWGLWVIGGAIIGFLCIKPVVWLLDNRWPDWWRE